MDGEKQNHLIIFYQKSAKYNFRINRATIPLNLFLIDSLRFM